MIELRLIHDGDFWIAGNGVWSARGRTLELLDDEVRSIVKKEHPGGDTKDLSVRMTFDNSTIPQWIRQYANHYFNRVISVDL